MDRLEKFIKEHRNELDRHEPGDSVWKGIESNYRSKPVTLGTIIYRAAMVVVILATAFIIFMAGRGSVTASGDLFMQADKSAGNELRETETYYTRKVNLLMDQAKPLLRQNPDLDTELRSDMGRLDSLCTEIKKDLRDNVSNREVIEALILNYRLKVQILEDMIETLNQEEFNTNEKRMENEI